MTHTDDSPPGPLELMESARAKYSLALGRIQRSPPELTLLSLHGSIEDALRGHAMRQRLPAATEPFLQLIEALMTDRKAPLGEAEAEGIRRMHRLRARVAHGEQIAVTATTIEAYQRLVARILPRYGILVVGGEDVKETDGPPRQGAEQPRRRNDEVESIPPRRSPERGRTTVRLTPPPRERSAYPDEQMARYTARPQRGAEPRAQFEGTDAGRLSILADRWQRSQVWVLPLLIIISIFLIGAAILISFQQLRAVQSLPTPAAATTPFAQPIATAGPTSRPGEVQAADSAQAPPATAPIKATPSPPPPTTPGELAIGQDARVSAGVPALNVRDRPGTDQAIPVIFVLQPGTRIKVVDGPVQADGLTWWKVRVANQDGWCAGQYLEAL